jgi:transcriptional regulator with XRE-family HTH domain
VKSGWRRNIMKTQVRSEDYQNFLDDLTGYYRDQEKGEEKTYIGERLKKIRELQGVSLEKLAKIAGVDEKFLREVENVKVFPDLGTIIKLSKALRIATGLLLDEASGYSYSVVRKEDRKLIQRTPSGSKDRPDYLYQSLSTGVKRRHMESFLVTLTGEEKEVELSSHDGEEFILVIEGEVRVMLGDRSETLKEGDTIYYLSTIPHALVSAGATQAVILAVIYTG